LSAKAIGIESKASAKALIAYCSKPPSCKCETKWGRESKQQTEIQRGRANPISFSGNSEPTGNFTRATTVYNSIVANEVASDTQSIMKRSLGLIDNHLWASANKNGYSSAKCRKTVSSQTAQEEKRSNKLRVGTLLDDQHSIASCTKTDFSH
jgi:hypothetical protein